MSVIVEIAETIADTQSSLSEELAAIAGQAFGTGFCPGFPDVHDSDSRTHALHAGIRFAPTHAGTRIELAVETEQGDLLHFAGEVPERESLALTRLAAVTQTAMQQRVQLQEQEEHLARHAAQVSHDFDMLVSMRELAERMQRNGLRQPAADVVESLLPCMRDMLRATEVVFVETSAVTDAASAVATHVTRMNRFGQVTLNDQELLDLVSNRVHARTFEPVVLNDGGVCDVVLDALSSILIVAMAGSPGAEGWLIATRCPEDWCEGSHLKRHYDREFGTIEAGLLKSVATFLSSHCRNVQLFQEQEKMLVGVVRAMVNAIDAKDSYTCGHSDRVAVIARILASELGLSEVECDRIYLTGLLHDIGKIGVPDSVLLKAGKLTDEEFDLIKKHPVIGYNVLSHLDEIAYVLPGVLHHHESLDGRGYPSGLRGIEIPLEARILAVADSFDAMTSNRPYRQGMSLEKASGIFQSSAGVQWDANVVGAFFNRRDEIVEASRLADAAISEGAIHYHDDNIARAVLSVRAK